MQNCQLNFISCFKMLNKGIYLIKWIWLGFRRQIRVPCFLIWYWIFFPSSSMMPCPCQRRMIWDMRYEKVRWTTGTKHRVVSQFTVSQQFPGLWAGSQIYNSCKYLHFLTFPIFISSHQFWNVVTVELRLVCGKTELLISARTLLWMQLIEQFLQEMVRPRDILLGMGYIITFCPN